MVYFGFTVIFMKRKAKKNKSIILRLMILGVCAYFTVTLVSLWRVLDDKRAELKVSQQKYDAMLNEVDELRSLLESDDKKIIEKAARERFGYAYPNEQIFKEISGN